MKAFHSFLLLFLALFSSGQIIPYNLSPDWESEPNGHIATGLGLADINGDGFKDLIVANGNDIQRQHLSVYYNDGSGQFPADPSWESSDIDYHGHLACGDIDQDGDNDVAVSVYLGAAGFSSPGKVKVYYNTGTQLESSPSFQSTAFYTFSCSLGDADGDGDLDLAAATGEPYSQLQDNAKIFLNNNGTFQASPEWESEILMGSLDVEFGDLNRDGHMDVIFVCEDNPNYIFLSDETGTINNESDWESAELQNFINSVDIGYENGSSQVVMTENNQLGGEGRVRKYNFSNDWPTTSAANWYSNPFGYGSGILLNDVDADGKNDLVYGGWWLPVKIATGTTLGFQLDPSYTSATSSVVEAILMADLGREALIPDTAQFVIETEMVGGHTLILPRQLVEEITFVAVNNISLSAGNYCWIPSKPWVSLSIPFQEGDDIQVGYTWSPHPDMVITNWDSGKGNYIFYNSGQVGYTDELVNYQSGHSLVIMPNPVSDKIGITLNVPAGDYTLRITGMDGRQYLLEKVKTDQRPYIFELNFVSWPPGIYLVNLNGNKLDFIKKIAVAR